MSTRAKAFLAVAFLVLCLLALLGLVLSAGSARR